MNKKIILFSISFFLILSSLLFIFTKEEVKTIVKYPLIDSVDRALIFIGLKEEIKIPAEDPPHGMPDLMRYSTSRGEITWDMFLPNTVFQYYPLPSDKYPYFFTVKENSTFFINHETEYDISNCDMGEWVEGSDSLVGQENETLKDLEWEITHYYDDIETVFKEKNPNTADQYLQNGKLVASDESGLKEVIIGPYEGIEQYVGVEGCGEYRYYLKTFKGTMFATRYITQAFTPIRPDYLANLALPGIITPSKEKAFFYKVISSIEIIPE